jgi:hypothetical protein
LMMPPLPCRRAHPKNISMDIPYVHFAMLADYGLGMPARMPSLMNIL